MPKRKTERFPLTLHHATGQWSKCFTLPSGGRKTVYFGTDRDAAHAKYLREKKDWQEGRNPRENVTTAPTAVTLADLVNAFLTRSKARVAENEISPLTFADYLAVGEQLTEHFGRNRDPQQFKPADFASFRRAVAAKYAPSRLSKTVVIARMMFNWAFESELLESSVRFGPDFNVAAKRATRTHRASMGEKLLTPAEIRKLLEHADEPLAAMILLGINCGLTIDEAAEQIRDWNRLHGSCETWATLRPKKRRRSIALEN